MERLPSYYTLTDCLPRCGLSNGLSNQKGKDSTTEKATDWSPSQRMPSLHKAPAVRWVEFYLGNGIGFLRQAACPPPCPTPRSKDTPGESAGPPQSSLSTLTLHIWEQKYFAKGNRISATTAARPPPCPTPKSPSLRVQSIPRNPGREVV